MSYRERYRRLLNDERWKRRRLEIMRRDGFRCRCCGSSSKLNVHHRWYIYGRRPWSYSDRCLVTLCEQCHHRLHMMRHIVSIVWTVILIAVAYVLSLSIK